MPGNPLTPKPAPLSPAADASTRSRSAAGHWDPAALDRLPVQEAAAAVRADQRRRWRAGNRVPLETYLADRPDLHDDPAVLIDLVYSEYLLAEESGTAQSPDAYAARFPSVARELADQVELHLALGTGLDGLDPDGPPANRPAAPALPGYEVLSELGRGGMGAVYLARQVALNRVVAIKTLLDPGRAESADAVRFLAEAESVAAVNHPNVVRVYESGRAGSVPYFAMERLPGGSLRDRLTAPGSIAPVEAARLLDKVARGVQAAHDQQVVHRDLKPANVLFDADGEPKVTDFGLARRGAGSGLTQTHAVLGTPAYMSPEQAQGKFVGPAADVWSLGAILYECLTGTVPFPGDDPLSVLQRVVHDDPDPPRQRNPAAPRDLDLVCLKCLQKDPADRYPSAAALADDLRRFAAGEAVTVRPAGRFERMVRWARRNPREARWVAAVAGLLVAIAGGGTAGAFWMRHERNTAQAAEEARRQEAIRSNRSVAGEVRAMRLRGQPGQYFTGLVKLRESLALARQLGAPGEDIDRIRNEMMNLFTVADVEVQAEWDGWPAGTDNVFFSRELDRYLLVAPGEALAVRHAPGGKIMYPFPSDVPPPVRAEFAPSGRQVLLVYGPPGRVELWDLDGDWPRLRWSVAAEAATFLSDPARVAVHGVFDGRRDVRILDAANGAEKRRIPNAYWNAAEAPAHRTRPWLALQRRNADRDEVAILNYVTGQEVRTFDRPAALARVGWHPTRPVLAVGSDKRIHVWDVSTGHDVHAPLPGYALPALYPGFDADGEMLLSSDPAGILWGWDPVSGRLRLAVPRHIVSGPIVPTTTGRLAVARHERRLQILRLYKGEGLRVAVPANPTTYGFTGTTVASPDGRLLAARVGDHWCALLDPATGAELAVLPTGVHPLAFLKNGDLLTTNPAGVQRWPVRHEAGTCRVGPPVRLADESPRTKPGPNPRTAWGASTDGRVLAESLFHRGLKVHWLADGKKVEVGPQRNVQWAAVSPDGEWVAAGSLVPAGPAFVTVYSARDGRRAADLLDRGGQPRFSPDGRSVAVIVVAGGVSVFTVGTWERRWLVDGYGCAFDPTGALVAVGEGRGVIRLRAADNGREVAVLEVPDDTRLVPQAFGPDGGRLLAVGWDNRQLYMWDLRRLRQRLVAEDLDWEWPPFGPPKNEPVPERVEVISREEAERRIAEAVAGVRTAAEMIEAWFRQSRGKVPPPKK